MIGTRDFYFIDAIYFTPGLNSHHTYSYITCKLVTYREHRTRVTCPTLVIFYRGGCLICVEKAAKKHGSIYFSNKALAVSRSTLLNEKCRSYTTIAATRPPSPRGEFHTQLT